MPYADPEARRAYHREYMKKRRQTPSQKEYDAALGKAYRKKNWDQIKVIMYRWREENPKEWKTIKQRNERRRQQQKKTSPLTCEERKQIDAIYKLRDHLTKTTGIEHHVDHIQPYAKGGLHIPSNLQVLPALENLSKGAKWD